MLSSVWLNSRHITRCIEAIRDDRYRARAEEVIVRYFLEPLENRLRARATAAGREYAEDAALLALHYALGRLQEENGEAFASRANLLALLTVVGKNRLHNFIRAERSAKRGGDRVLRDSELESCAEHVGSGLEQEPDPAPPPDYSVAAAEEYQRLLGLLEQDLCQVALWKVEGFTNREIALKLGCVETTVERKLQRIRTLLGGSRN